MSDAPQASAQTEGGSASATAPDPSAETTSAPDLAPQDAPPPKPWWMLEAPKTSGLIFVGEGSTFARARALCAAMKLGVENADLSKLAEFLAQADPAKAILLEIGATRDPAIEAFATLRRTPQIRNRRVLAALASNEQRLLQKAYALTPTGVWLPPHDEKLFAGLLLLPRKCG